MALLKKQIRIVQAALLGSILANLLLILGMSFLWGGLHYKVQVYNATVTHLSACLLSLAVLSLLIPTAFHASFSDEVKAEEKVLLVSRGTAVILLLVYILYVLFQLVSHSSLYEPIPRDVIDAESSAGILHSSSSSPLSAMLTGGNARLRRIRCKKIRARLGRKRRARIEPEVDTNEHSGPLPSQPQNHDSAATEEAAAVQPSASGDPATAPQAQSANHRLALCGIRLPPVFRRSVEPTQDGRRSGHMSRPRRIAIHRGHSALQAATGSGEAPLSKVTSVLLLLGSTALVALCAEFMVGSIGKLVETTSLSEAFVGLIILPIVGNAAEHVTAVKVAAKNKMDLAIGVAIGSSIQIALFVTPSVVLIGWMASKDMPLYFTLFETVALFVATFVVNFLVLDGKSNYLEGALLCSCYIIIAVAAFFFPDVVDQSKSSGPPGQRVSS